jgi:hypothetical protein
VRLLKKTKCPSEMIFPLGVHISAEASRSNSAPAVVRGSQPRPSTRLGPFQRTLFGRTQNPAAVRSARPWDSLGHGSRVLLLSVVNEQQRRSAAGRQHIVNRIQVPEGA